MTLCAVPGNDCSGLIADIVFLVDSSGSIRDADVAGEEPNYNQMRAFIASLVESFTYGNDGIRVGAVTFSNRARNRFFLNTHASRDAVVNAITNLPYDGGFTYTGEALALMKDVQFTAENGDRPDVPNIAIVLTDGASNVNESLTIPLAEMARAEGITIYSIGITNSINETEVRLMSSEPQELGVNYYLSEDFAGLSDLTTQLTTATCDADPSMSCD